MSDELSIGEAFERLGLKRSASGDEIASAYRKLALLHHPDKNPGDEEARNQFQAAAEAFALLSDPDKRKAAELREASYGPSNPDAAEAKLFQQYPDIAKTIIRKIFEAAAKHQNALVGWHVKPAQVSPAVHVTFEFKDDSVEANKLKHTLMNALVVMHAYTLRREYVTIGENKGAFQDLPIEPIKKPFNQLNIYITPQTDMQLPEMLDHYSSLLICEDGLRHDNAHPVKLSMLARNFDLDIFHKRHWDTPKFKKHLEKVLAKFPWIVAQFQDSDVRLPGVNFSRMKQYPPPEPYAPPAELKDADLDTSDYSFILTNGLKLLFRRSDNKFGIIGDMKMEDSGRRLPSQLSILDKNFFNELIKHQIIPQELKDKVHFGTFSAKEAIRKGKNAAKKNDGIDLD